MSRSIKRLIVAPCREHSRKPDEAHERIERLVGGPYLELFARTSRPGWTSWGNQTNLFDAGATSTPRSPPAVARPQCPQADLFEGR